VLTLQEMKELNLHGKGHAETLLASMGAVHDRCEDALDSGGVPCILDPMLGYSISTQWDRDSFEAFMRRLSEGKKWLARVIASEEHSEAVELCQRLFGEDAFPGYTPECAYCRGERGKAAHLAGTLMVTHGSNPRVVVGSIPNATRVDPKARTWGQGDFK